MSTPNFAVRPTGPVSVQAEEIGQLQQVKFSVASGRSITVQASKKSDMAMIYRIPVLGWIARRVMGLFEIRAGREIYLVSKEHAIKQLKEVKGSSVNTAVERGGRISHIMLEYLNSAPTVAAPAPGAATVAPDASSDYNLNEAMGSKTKQALGTLLVRLGIIGGHPMSIDALASEVKNGRDIALGGERPLSSVMLFSDRSEAMRRLDSLIEFVQRNAEVGFEYETVTGSESLPLARMQDVMALLREVKVKASTA